MTSEFRAAFEELESVEGAIDPALLQRLSAPEAEDVDWFRERFPRLPELLRIALLAAMVEHAELDFELYFHDLYRVALDDPQPSVRRTAIEGLWEDERLDLARRLLRILTDDPSDEVRAAATQALGRYVYRAECEELDPERGRRVRIALEQAHEGSGSVEVARRALESLAFINDERITRLIDQAYAHANPLMRQSAMFAMGRSADPLWAETVLAELHSDDPGMRFEAARASGELRLARAVPMLARLIAGDRDAEVQTMAIWALGEIGGKRAQELLEQISEGEDPVQSTAADEALERIDFAGHSIDMLLFDLEDPEAGHGHAHGRPEAAELAPAEDEQAEEEAPGPDSAYRRDFRRYTDEDEADDTEEDDDEEWPDEFLERE